MRGQTQIHDCAFCGAAAETEILIEPAQFRLVKGVKQLAKLEVRAWVCIDHVRSCEDPPSEKVLRSKATDVEQLVLE